MLLLLALSLFFINVGVDHFINPDFYLNIMPDYLPFHAEAVYLSGFFEILGGIVVLIPKLRALARWGLISLLIAVFPANIYMAMNPNLFPEFSLALLYFRLPLQFVFIFWVLKATEMVRD
ncbi:MAG: DoxX family protein [SAR92 bacterium MED-G29]|nr:DoxX family protein [Porticoccaceae bacterium]PDH30689.1 MAG: DoxX family protein [SAR92 bacterium MED-G29]